MALRLPVRRRNAPRSGAGWAFSGVVLFVFTACHATCRVWQCLSGDDEVGSLEGRTSLHAQYFILFSVFFCLAVGWFVAWLSCS